MKRLTTFVIGFLLVTQLGAVARAEGYDEPPPEEEVTEDGKPAPNGVPSMVAAPSAAEEQLAALTNTMKALQTQVKELAAKLEAPEESEKTDAPLPALESEHVEEAYRAAVRSLGQRYGFEPNELPPTPQHYYRGDRAVLFFGMDGQPFWGLPQIDEDDEVFLVVLHYAEHEGRRYQVSALQITVCEAPPANRIAGSVPSEVFQKGRGYTVGHVIGMASSCRGEKGIEASFTTTPTGGTKRKQTIKVPTLQLYRFTLMPSFVFDFGIADQFKAQNIVGKTTPVVVKDQDVVGVAPLVLVSFRPEPADLSRPRLDTLRGWASSFHLGLGLNVAEPLEHVYVVGGWEPWVGVGLIVGAHWGRQASLGGGLKELDPVPEGDIPTFLRWDPVPSLIVGVSVDGAVVAELITKLNP